MDSDNGIAGAAVRSAAHRPPTGASGPKTDRSVKSCGRRLAATPPCTSGHVSGVNTPANGLALAR